jgi:tetratricopeptide (TPR) repeat protein
MRAAINFASREMLRSRTLLFRRRTISFRIRTISLAVAAAALLTGARAHAGPDPILSDRLFDDANAAFLSGDLARAAAAWQALLEEGVASVEVETNLGVALFRENKRGLAALHFERALFLDPGDDDARADLAELRRSNVDRLEGDSEEGGDGALFHLFAPLPGKAAALLLVVSWALACALFGARAFAPRLREKRALGTAMWSLFALALVSGAVSAASATAHKLALQRAVMTAPSTPAREGPQASAQSGFEVHEGTLVRVEDEQSGFARVRLQNGLVGWVPSESVERVVLPRWGGAR